MAETIESLVRAAIDDTLSREETLPALRVPGPPNVINRNAFDQSVKALRELQYSSQTSGPKSSFGQVVSHLDLIGRSALRLAALNEISVPEPMAYRRALLDFSKGVSDHVMAIVVHPDYTPPRSYP